VRQRVGDEEAGMAATPVVFIHGLWLHATSWEPWQDTFREAGYEPVAPGWPGEPDTVAAARAEPAAVAGKGLDDIVGRYAAVVEALPAKPVLVGHSFGGLIVQRLLGQGLGAAGVAIDAAPIKGVLYLPPSALRVAGIVLRNPLNRNGTTMLTAGQFRYGFGNALGEDESNELYDKYAVPSPAKPLFEAAMANLLIRSPAKVDTGRADRGPLLLIAGGRDHTVPAAVTRATRKLYQKSSAITDYREFPDRGHSLAMDHGWAEVAGASLDWLRQQTA
jgi:pimeloyl-ACP methyl ester carboxylesterase